ncbi:MAG: hypothetical protein VB817_11235, partial [Pirellulaceae bacterium]
DTPDSVASDLRIAMAFTSGLDFDLENTHRHDDIAETDLLVDFHGERVNLGFAFDHPDQGATDVVPSTHLESLGFVEGQTGSNFTTVGFNIVLPLDDGGNPPDPLRAGDAISHGRDIFFTHPDPNGIPGDADDNTVLQLEFRRQPFPGTPATPPKVTVFFNDDMTAVQLADAVTLALINDNSPAKAALGLQGIVSGGGEVQVIAIAGTEVTTNENDIDINEIGNTLVYVHEAMDREDVADELNRLLEPHFYTPTIVAVGGLDNAVDDGDAFTLSDGESTVTFELDSGFVIQIPSNGAVDIADGETLSFTNLGPDGAVGGGDDLQFVLEIDKDASGPAAGNVEVVIADGQPRDQVALILFDAIDTALASTDVDELGLEAQVISGGRVRVYSINNTDLVISSANITQAGSGNVGANNIAVRYDPSSSFSGSDMADAIADAINNGVDDHPGADGIEGNTDDPVLLISATVPQAGPAQAARRVQLTRENGTNSQIAFDGNNTPFDLEIDQNDVIANDIVKQHHDMLRIIGHTVVDHGPLGLEDS